MDNGAQVFVVDDHPLMRKALVGLLREEFGLRAIRELSSLRELQDNLALGPARLVLVDLNLTDATPEQTIAALPELSARASVLVLSGQLTQGVAWRCRAAGALGAIGKHTAREPLRHYLSDALEGRCVPHLSNRQREVLALLAQGMDTKHIASEFGIAPTTVYEYIKDIYKALRVNSRTSCLLAARELGLIDIHGGLPAPSNAPRAQS